MHEQHQKPNRNVACMLMFYPIFPAENDKQKKATTTNFH